MLSHHGEVRMDYSRQRFLSRSCWHLSLIVVLSTLSVLASWALIVPMAAAAARTPLTSASVPASTPVHTTSTANQPSSGRARALAQQARILAPHKAHVSAKSPYNGLGDLPFYSYVYQRNLSDQLQMKVNVANGNLLLHATPEKIHGTGLDLALDSYFDSQYNNYVLDDGSNWNFSYGRGVTLELSDISQGITLYGPSGFAVYFASAGNDTFKDAPGLNATLKKSGDNYQLKFHHNGLQWLFSDRDGSLYNIQDANSNQIAYNYDDNGNLTSITDTQGRTVTFTQNDAHQITTITDSNGRTTTYAYNNTVDLTSITNTNNEQTSFTYDSKDRVISVTDPNGKSTSITYTSGGQVATITDANDSVTNFTYNSGNTVVTDVNGHSTTYAYNNLLQVTKTTDALDHSSSSTFDAANYNVTQTGDALSNFSNFVFSADGRNNLLSSSAGASGSNSGAKTTFGYPTSGNNLYYPMSQTDPQGNQTDYAYDSNGNMLSATHHKTSKTLKYDYNANGTVTKQTDFDGNVTSFGYDSKGNLSSVTPPSPLGKTALAVDALSRESSVTDGDNQTTSYSYDNADRLVSITYADNSTVSYSYDRNGNVFSEADNTGRTSFTYDVLNRITTKTLPGGTTISTSYDKLGNLTSYNDGAGAVSYDYDAANRMTTLTEPDGAQTKYGYDKANRKTKIQYPNGTGMVLTYDAMGHELTNVGGTMNSNGNIQTTYDNFAYNYMQGSNQTALLQSTTISVDPVQGKNAWAYSYDSKNHLSQAKKTDGSNLVREYNYTYDENGNRIQDVLKLPNKSDAKTSYTYGAGNELLSKQVQGGATTTYSYDGNGNQTGSTGGPSFTYNAKDQAITLGSGTSATYSGTDQTERVQVNNTSFVYGTLNLTSEQTSSGTTAFVRCSCGLLNNERTPDGKKYYYLFDGLGSIVAMTDGNGARVSSYDYDPYGTLLNSTQKSGLNNPWMFAGGFFDSSIGLYKYGIRYYDSTIGRWTQRTPVGGSLQETTKANPYLYADDDPVNAVDPSGRFNLTSDCLAAIAFAAPTAFGFVQQVNAFAGNILGAGGELLAESVATADPITAAIGISLMLAAGITFVVGIGTIVGGFYYAIRGACSLP